MTYEADDTSIQDSRPRELFTFTIGGSAFRYTSHDTAVIYSSNTYEPLAGLRRDFTAKVRDAADAGEVEIQIPRASDLAVLLTGAGALPEYESSVEVRRLQLESGEARLVYQGSIVGVSRRGNFAAVRALHSLASLQSIRIPKVQAQKQCSYQLYGTGCGVNRLAGGGSLYRHTTTIADIVSNVEIEVADLDPTYEVSQYAGGELWIGNAKRTIMTAEGTTLRLLAPLLIDTGGLPSGSGVSVGDTVYVFVGCDHTIDQCSDVFANEDNFGGLPFIGDALRPFVAQVIGGLPPAIDPNRKV